MDTLSWPQVAGDIQRWFLARYKPALAIRTLLIMTDQHATIRIRYQPTYHIAVKITTLQQFKYT